MWDIVVVRVKSYSYLLSASSEYYFIGGLNIVNKNTKDIDKQ